MLEWTFRPSTKKRMIDEMNMWDTFATLVSSGVPILLTLNLTSKYCPRFAKEIGTMHDDIKEGERIMGVFKKYPNSFHPIIPYIVDVGEETGALPDMLFKGRNLIESDLVKGVDARNRAWCPIKERSAFLDYSALLVGEGIPLVRVFNAVSEIPYLSRMKQTILDINESIESGNMFSEAVAARASKYFTESDINLIKAGEVGGTLDITLKRLANYSQGKPISHGYNNW